MRFDLQFKTNGGSVKPGIGIAVFGADLSNLAGKIPISAGNTDANGYLGVDVPGPGQYQFTSSDVAFPTPAYFYAGSVNPIVVTPASATNTASDVGGGNVVAGAPLAKAAGIAVTAITLPSATGSGHPIAGGTAGAAHGSSGLATAYATGTGKFGFVVPATAADEQLLIEGAVTVQYTAAGSAPEGVEFALEWATDAPGAIHLLSETHYDEGDDTRANTVEVPFAVIVPASQTGAAVTVQAYIAADPGALALSQPAIMNLRVKVSEIAA